MLLSKKYITILVVLLAFASCKKEELPDISGNDPIFSVSFEDENNVSNKWIAGDDGWFLNTGTDVISSLNTNYGQLDCNVDNSFFRIDYFSEEGLSLNNNIQNLNGLIDLFTFSENSISKFEFNGDIDQIVSALWSVNGADYSLIDLNQINSPGVYDICVKVSFAEGCTRMICNTFYIGITNPVTARFTIDEIDTLNTKCTANIIGDYDHVDWYVNDVFYASGISVNFDSLSYGFHRISLKVKDASGDQLAGWNSLITRGEVLCRLQSFDIFSDLNSIIKEKNILISYQDENGDLFTSYLSDIPAEMRISNVELYDEQNDNFQDVIRFTIEGDFTLKNTEGIPKIFKNFKGEFGIAL